MPIKYCIHNHRRAFLTTRPDRDDILQHAPVGTQFYDTPWSRHSFATCRVGTQFTTNPCQNAVLRHACAPTIEGSRRMLASTSAPTATMYDIGKTSLCISAPSNDTDTVRFIEEIYRQHPGTQLSLVEGPGLRCTRTERRTTTWLSELVNYFAG